MTSDSSILRRIWNRLNRMQRTAVVIAILCVFMIGGALYWEEDYEKRFVGWTSTDATTVRSTFTTLPAWMSLLGLRPAYYGTATLRFNAGEKAIATEVQFVYHSLFRSDVDGCTTVACGGSVTSRFQPGASAGPRQHVPYAIFLSLSMPAVSSRAAGGNLVTVGELLKPWQG